MASCTDITSGSLKDDLEEHSLMQTATVITHGVSQSVQLPEGFHIHGKEVYVKRVGRSVLLIPTDVDPWDILTESLDHFTSDFMMDRCQPAQQQRQEPFP
jgi:antitoxin VapB